MLLSRSKTSAALAPTLVLASAASLAACQSPSTGADSYRQTDTETVTDVSSGMRKQVKHWQYEDGTVTQSTKVVFNPQAGRSPRGTKAH